LIFNTNFCTQPTCILLPFAKRFKTKIIEGDLNPNPYNNFVHCYSRSTSSQNPTRKQWKMFFSKTHMDFNQRCTNDQIVWYVSKLWCHELLAKSNWLNLLEHKLLMLEEEYFVTIFEKKLPQ
jgi:hypothetical protein